MKALMLLAMFLAVPGLAEYPYNNSQTATINANNEAVKAALEGLRDKLNTPDLAKLKDGINAYLTAFGAANEEVNAAREEVKKLKETEIPPLETRLAELEKKREEYKAGKLKEEDYAPSRTALEKLEMDLAAARKKLAEKEALLAPIETKFNTAQANLTNARRPIKDAEDKLLAAMTQSLAGMSLMANIDSVKVEGLEAEHRLALVEAGLSDTVLEHYLRGKMNKLIGSQAFCQATKNCTVQYGTTPPNADLKEVFPGAKSHTPEKK